MYLVKKITSKEYKECHEIDLITIKESQHEILIEKEKIRKKALSLIHTFLKS